MAMSATEKGAVVLLVTGVVAPLIGLLLRRVSGGWDEIGRGPFSMQHEPQAARRPAAAAPGLTGFAEEEPVDREAQKAEVRQMLEAKAERQRRQGDDPIDVEAEVRRLLRPRLTIS